MNDEIFKGKRMLTETEAMWNLALGTVFEDERHLAFKAYRDSIQASVKNLSEAIDEWLERHPQPHSEG